MVEPLYHVGHMVYFHLDDNHVLAVSFEFEPLYSNDSKHNFCFNQLYYDLKFKISIILNSDYLLVVHCKVVLVEDIYVDPIEEVVLDVMVALNVVDPVTNSVEVEIQVDIQVLDIG